MVIMQARHTLLLGLALSSACSSVLKKNSTSNGGDSAPTPPPAAAPTKLDLATEIQGLPAKDGVLHADNITLNFDLSGGDKNNAKLKAEGFECRFSATGKWVPCSTTHLAINSLRNGDTLDLGVRGVLRDTDTNTVIYASEADVHLQVDLSGGGQTPLPADVNAIRALGNSVQLGDAYQLTVPVGMHITEYSTSKTTGVLSYFRILPESDPYYLGNFGCARDFDRVVAGGSPAGEPLMYCHSTPSRDTYKGDSEDRLANNHAEIATDTKLVTKEGQERLSISIFDADYEFMASTSRFGSICRNAVKRFITVPMIPNFFLTKTPESVDFWMCDVYLPDMDGAAQQWRVGAFFNVDHMDWNCPNCKYPRAVEAVYMSRVNVANHLDANFAKITQQRILDTLTKLTP